LEPFLLQQLQSGLSPHFDIVEGFFATALGPSLAGAFLTGAGDFVVAGVAVFFAGVGLVDGLVLTGVLLAAPLTAFGFGASFCPVFATEGVFG
jgi:hypothetical protein